jgi:hypothetical protein
MTVQMAWKARGEEVSLWGSEGRGVGGWGPPKPFRGTGGSRYGPALADIEGGIRSPGIPAPPPIPHAGIVVMAWRGIGQDDTIWWSVLDRGWSPQRVVANDFHTGDRPAVCRHGNQVLLVWKGPAGMRPYTAPDPRLFWSVFDGRSNGRAYMAWKGKGNDSRLFWSTLQDRSWTQQREVPGVGGSSHGPALSPVYTPDGLELMLAWKGKGDDARIFWSLYDGSWSEQHEAGGGLLTSHGPALVYRHALYL